MKTVLFFCLLFAIGCQNQPSSSSSIATPQNYQEYCDMLNKSLIGSFATRYAEGTMTWNGGLTGSVEIAGSDYNEMTCTYEIVNCETGSIKMICDGGVFNTTVEMISLDSMKINNTGYRRVQ